MSNDIKHFLYAWCGKQRKTPNYDVSQINIKHGQRFKYEVRVDGFDYIGIGNSTNKKDAQTNAALDFCQYLVRSGVISQNDLPIANREANSENPGSNQHNSNYSNLPTGIIAPHLSMGLSCNEDNKNSMLPYNRGPPAQYLAQLASNRRMVEDAEDTDVNAEIHGYWTIETAKSRLHQYLQQNKIKTDYRFTSTGPDNNRSFFAEMAFYVSQKGMKIYGKEYGSTKQIASKACALSIARQLFHLGVIEAYSGEKKKKERPKTAPFVVDVSAELKDYLAETCETFQLEPILRFEGDGPISLLIENQKSLYEKSEKRRGTTIPWCPPMQNWNPWLGCNIDDGPLASATLDQISADLSSFHSRQVKDRNYLHMLNERKALPVYNFKDQILQTIDHNPVTLVRGSTGCGKTTQISQYILEKYLEQGCGSHCNIVCTQPRRISAVSVAERVSHERCESLGNSSVGYSVRFESVLPRPYGGILFCTVGVLLRRLENGLRGVSHVIVDEIHERDINTDFLLVLLRDMLRVHKNLRVILMSATIDTTLFSEYFGNCPIVEIHGKAHPVTEYFLEDIVQLLNFVPPLPGRKRKNKSQDDGGDDDDEDIVEVDDIDDQNCNAMVSPVYTEHTRNSMKEISEKVLPFEVIEELIKYITSLNQPGAILIFLPGWNLIYSLLKYLHEHPQFGNSAKFRLLPLHSQVPREEQSKVFEDAPVGMTKIIVSTNIAESSITINDVVFVIDSCKVKQKIFTSRNNMTNYATVWASKANMEQRKGRAGRVRSGFCFYLISRARYERLENHATPEIFRTPLHELALSIKLLRLGEIKEFLSRAIEPPPLDAVCEAEIALKEMHALDVNGELTHLGRILARLPIEPKLGRMIVMGCIFLVGDAVCTIAAATTFSEPFLHDGKHLRMMHKNLAGSRQSDHVALLNAFQQWLKAKWRGEQAEVEFCDRSFLNMSIMRMTYEARNQLKDIMLKSGFPEGCLHEINFDVNGTDTKLDIVTSLLCNALYPNVCYHTEKRKLITCDGKQALINVNSVNCSRELVHFPSPFFVFGEKIKTRAISAKQMTMVSPLQLLLFGSDKVDTNALDVDLVYLDNWITLKMERELAAIVVSLRVAFERILMMATQDPQVILTNPPQIEYLSRVLLMLSDQNCNHIVYSRVDETLTTTLTRPTGSKRPVMQYENDGEPDTKRFHTSEASPLFTNHLFENNSNRGSKGAHRGGHSNISGGRGNYNSSYRSRGRGNNSGFRGAKRAFNNNSQNTAVPFMRNTNHNAVQSPITTPSTPVKSNPYAQQMQNQILPLIPSQIKSSPSSLMPNSYNQSYNESQNFIPLPVTPSKPNHSSNNFLNTGDGSKMLNAFNDYDSKSKFSNSRGRGGSNRSRRGNRGSKGGGRYFSR